MTREETTLLAKLAWAQWPNHKIDEFVTEAMFQVLKERTFDECQRAAVALLRTPREFPPTAGQIDEVIKSERRRALQQFKALPEPEKPVDPKFLEQFWKDNPALAKALKSES